MLDVRRDESQIGMSLDSFCIRLRFWLITVLNTSPSTPAPVVLQGLGAGSEGELDGLAQSVMGTAHTRPWAGRTRLAWVEDDEEDEEGGGQGGEDDEMEYEYEWGTEDYDADKYAAISVWDQISELFLRMGETTGA